MRNIARSIAIFTLGALPASAPLPAMAVPGQGIDRLVDALAALPEFNATAVGYYGPGSSGESVPTMAGLLTYLEENWLPTLAGDGLGLSWQVVGDLVRLQLTGTLGYERNVAATTR